MAIKSSFIYPRFIAINELNFPFYQTTHFNKHLINILQSLDNFEYFPDMVVPFQQFIPGENAQEISFLLLLLLCPILNCPSSFLFSLLQLPWHKWNFPSRALFDDTAQQQPRKWTTYWPSFQERKEGRTKGRKGNGIPFIKSLQVGEIQESPW